MNVATKTKIKDWFIITRIRILNFIKEHKYVSAFIGILLLSMVVMLIVKAAENSTSSFASIENANVVILKDGNEISEPTIDTFSELTYNVSYSLKDCSTDAPLDYVKIEALLPKNSAYEWLEADESVESSIEDVVENEVTYTKLSVFISSQSCDNTPKSQNLTLYVKNASKNITIDPKIIITPGSSGDGKKQTFSNVKKITPTYTSEYTITPKINAAISKKITNSNEKETYFGLLLGIEKFDKKSLKGVYFNVDQSVMLLATQGDSNDLEISEDGVGVYNASLNYFSSDKIPYFGQNSGSVTIGKSKDYFPDKKDGEVIAPKIKMVGSNNIVYEKYPSSSTQTYEDNQNVLFDETGNKIDGYDEEIYKEGQTDPVRNIPLNTEGTYSIHYKVVTNDYTITMIRKIKVEKPANDSYSLSGPKEMYVSQNTQYNDLGIYDISSGKLLSSSNYSISYFKGDSEITKDEMQSNVGNYTVKYSILDSNISLERKIVVTSEEKYTESKKVAAADSYVYKGSSYVDQGLKVNDTDFSCVDSNNCSFTPKTIDTKLGEQTIRYTIKNDDSIITISKNIHVSPQYYELKIANLTIDDNSMICDNDYCSFASYYIKVKPGNTSNTSIKLKALIGDKASEYNLSNQYSNGEDSESKGELYVKENEDFKIVDSSDINGKYYTAAIGEEVKFTSKFTYSYGASDDIDSLSVTIPVNKYLKPTSWSTEISDESYVDINATNFGDAIETIKTTNVKYCINDQCKSPIEISEDDIDQVSSIQFDVINAGGKISPGTVININTKFIVKNINLSSTEAKDLTKAIINETANYKFGNNITISSQTKNVYVTPYKTRASVGIGRNDNYSQSDNITVDISKGNTYTIFALPSITSPAMSLETDVLGYNYIRTLPITIRLPKGVNYIYNKNYELTPTVSTCGEETCLTYVYTNVSPNTWIEPIYADFNLDINLQNSSLDIKVQVGNIETEKTILNDISSNEYKIITKTLNIQNTEEISYGQYIYSDSTQTKHISNIDKNGEFYFTTKLYNRSDKIIDNLDVYTVLPHNDQLSENDSKFSGSILLNNLPNGSVCTSDKVNQISQMKNINWQSCEDFKTTDGKYSNLTAYKTSLSSFSPNQFMTNGVTVKTIGSQPDDKFVFKSYFKSSNSSSYKSFNDISIDIVSKKISGTVWEDFDANGIMDDDEKRVENVTLNLYNSNDELIQTTMPNEDGNYTFSGVNEGDYYIVADFNTDKYGITGKPSLDYYDKSKISAFSAISSSKDDSDTNTQSVEQDDEDDSSDIDDSNEEDDSNDSDDFMQDNIELVRTETITVTSETRQINYINLGLLLRKKYEVKVNKYITRAEITNALGFVTIKDYNNTKLAKLDVKDINNVKIKVVYTLEISNVKYYPMYVDLVTEQIPDGMSFNANYEENKGWTLNDDGSLTNDSLSNDPISENEKRYLTVAFDITRKEAGSFVNYASVDEVNILGGNIYEN